MTTAELRQATLARRFPRWHVWYVPTATSGAVTWHAILWRDDTDDGPGRAEKIVHADSADGLADALTHWEAEHGPPAPAAANDGPARRNR